MKRFAVLLSALALFAPLVVPAVAQSPSAESARVRVKLTYLSVAAPRVGRMILPAPTPGARRDDLSVYREAIRRTHADSVLVDGPIVTAARGKPGLAESVRQSATTARFLHDSVSVTVLSLNSSTASVRVRDMVSGTIETGYGRSAQVHSVRSTVVDAATYHDGETRILSGLPMPGHRNRYFFATVHILPPGKG